MPIIIPRAIPAFKVLKDENVFVMGKQRANRQDIRPIEIGILNLMPTKIETEIQLMRLLANSPLQINITLVTTASYVGKHTPREHLEKFYKTFNEVKNQKFDGFILTGAPVETLEYNEVFYWKELGEVFDFIKSNVTSAIHICWGAQAALYHFFGIKKLPLDEKLFGLFGNKALVNYDPLLKGLDDTFIIPHSRHTKIDEDAVKANKKLVVLAEGEECGISIAKTKDDKMFFFFGHSEYGKDTLKKEYLRDKAKGLNIAPPAGGYFIDGDVNNINFSWNSTANLLFYNWLNHYVYQITPYDIEQI